MNGGYFVGGYVFDFIRSLDSHVSIAGFQPTPHEQLFAISLALEILLFPAIYFLRRNAERERTITETDVARSGFWTGIAATVRRSSNETAALFRRLVGQSGFYRLLVFFLFIGFLKAIFLQMDYVFPKFGDREMGLHAPVGKLAGINAALIIVLAPVIGALTQRLASYRMVIIGGINFTVGVFVIALPAGWVVPAANNAPGHLVGPR